MGRAAAPTSVVLVRGVNVGGHNRLAMADLRRVLEELGAQRVSTVLQSGNAVVEGDLPDLGPRLEQALAAAVDLRVRVFVRTTAELAAVVAANPFPERVAQPKQLHVVFLDEQPDPAVVDGVHGGDEVRAGDRVLYLSYAGNSYTSPLTPVLRRVAPVSTARNWATLTRLLATVAA